MMGKRCLYCYQPLAESETDFHAKCSRKIFGSAIPPELPFSEEEMEPLAKTVIENQTGLTGVQPKLSLHLTTDKNGPGRFTIVGFGVAISLNLPPPIIPNFPR
jgi:serine/threonine-protein kinase HipA